MLESIYQDIISPDVNLAGSIVKLVLSLVLGATIGFEGNTRTHPEHDG